MKGGLGNLMKQAQLMQENMKSCRSSWPSWKSRARPLPAR